jgi:tetrahydromethanopterin S-methyltransferase subunit G
MTKEEREEREEEIRYLKKESISIKSRLIDIERRMEYVSRREAEKLGNIIGRLEAWHNS